MTALKAFMKPFEAPSAKWKFNLIFFSPSGIGSGVLAVELEHISHLFSTFLLLNFVR